MELLIPTPFLAPVGSLLRVETPLLVVSESARENGESLGVSRDGGGDKVSAASSLAIAVSTGKEVPWLTVTNGHDAKLIVTATWRERLITSSRESLLVS